MPSLETHLERYSNKLDEEFVSIREQYSDSGVKGSSNEKILSDFLSGHIKYWEFLNNEIIFDSEGEESGEIDIAACRSEYMWDDGQNLPQISESVEAAIQVKAIINSRELDRIQKNAKSVKRLRRKQNKGDKVFHRCDVSSSSAKEWLNQIPYIVFAYESELSLESLKNGVESIDEIDFLVIKDKNVVMINCKDGSIYQLEIGGQKIKEWFGLTTPGGGYTLFELLRYLIAFTPKINRASHPLRNYFNEIDLKSGYSTF